MLCAIACGEGNGVIAETSTGPTTSTTTEASTIEPTSTTSATDVATSGTSSEDGTSSSDASTSLVDSSSESGAPSCDAWTTTRSCEAAGCSAWQGEAFSWESATGVCASLGETMICSDAEGALPAPSYYWRAGADGGVDIVMLNSSPFSVGEWERCGCGPGDPFACYGCNAGTGCSSGDTCNDATDAESCAAEPDPSCVWVETSTYADDGTSCEPTSVGGRCVIGLEDKASCELAVPPPRCAEWTDDAPPYARPVDGGVEVIQWSSCDALPHGYMPCWSAGVGDPAACECLC